MAELIGGLGLPIVATLFGGYPLMDAPGIKIAELGVDRLEPTQADRRLTTTNLHVYRWEKRNDALNLRLRLGLSLTYAEGHITQLTGDLNAGTLREERFHSPAWGAGPAAEGSVEVWSSARTRLSLDLSSAILLYDRRFPAGGDRYNGMLQIGPSLRYAPTRAQAVSVGYRWMHVSNGQGEGPHNPAYEAKGLTLRYQHTW